jgi:hypothetical protein
MFTLEEKRGVCDFRNDWILSHLGQHATTTIVQCLVIVDKSFMFPSRLSRILK